MDISTKYTTVPMTKYIAALDVVKCILTWKTIKFNYVSQSVEKICFPAKVLSNYLLKSHTITFFAVGIRPCGLIIKGALAKRSIGAIGTTFYCNDMNFKLASWIFNLIQRFSHLNKDVSGTGLLQSICSAFSPQGTTILLPSAKSSGYPLDIFNKFSDIMVLKASSLLIAGCKSCPPFS